MHICDLLDRRAVNLTAAPINKESAINDLVDSLAGTGCLSDTERFRAAVFDRERKGSTGFGEGVAIPHAKSAGVSRPALSAMVVKNGVEFDSIDGEPVNLIFLIASPHNASDAHLDVLARLSSLLIDENFRKALISAKSVDEFLSYINEAEKKELNKEEEEHKEQEKQQENTHQSESKATAPVYDLVAVTACPAGLSHTYMAAEALEHKAKEMGISIKVEADGAAGNRNQLMPEEIANAKAVIVAADRAVNIDRFIGKRMVRVGVVDGVRRPLELITKALDPNCPVYSAGALSESSNIPMKLYRHLMSGLTYILPLAATAGILSAVARLDFVRDTELGLFLDTIGYSIGALLFPVLSAFIAFSMAGRMALVAGFTGGVMADMADAGVIGAVLNGFVGGGVAFLSARLAARFLKGHDAMFALLVYPLLGAVLTTIIAKFITNIPAILVDSAIEIFLSGANAWVLAIIGAILGGMMAADMGGPCNKIAYACGVLLLGDCLPEVGPGCLVMAAVMAGGMVPPIAAGLGALLFKHCFSKPEQGLAWTAISKGFLFITEGVYPFLAINPTKMRIACISGAAVAGALSMFFSCGLCAPHGGIFIVILAENPLFYLLSLLCGVIVSTILFRVGRKPLHLES